MCGRLLLAWSASTTYPALCDTLLCFIASGPHSDCDEDGAHEEREKEHARRRANEGQGGLAGHAREEGAYVRQVRHSAAVQTVSGKWAMMLLVMIAMG